MTTSKNKIILYPYQIYSESAKALQDEIVSRSISCKRFRKDKDYLIGPYSTIVNWGNSEWPKWLSTKRDILNPPHKVKDACNKILTFKLLSKKYRSYIPAWTENKDQAVILNKLGHTILARTKVEGSGGEGIVVIEPKQPDKIPPAPLYVQYIKKKYEFRVHVFNGQVIDVQQKKRNMDIDIVNTQIRSHANGWVFSRENLAPEAQSRHMHKLAIDIVGALQLDFGAVDIIYNSDRESFYALEVNTAPGLEGQTVKTYADQIIKYNTERQQQLHWR